MNDKRENSQENGNVLFLILIAVALFAALSYAVTSSTRTDGASASKEQAVLYSSQIIQSVTAIENAITRLKISNQCSDNQINFANPIFYQYPWDHYSNTNAPADKLCDVFAVEGGSVSPTQLPAEAFSPCCVGGQRDTEYRYPRFSGQGVLDIGTSEPDLILLIGSIKRDVCIELNKKLGVENPLGEPPQVSGTCYNGQGWFDGTYGTSNITWCGLDQVRSACVYDDYGPFYYFYNALIIR